MRAFRRTHTSERSIIRVSLFAGFGLVFALWTAMAWDVGRHMWVVQARTVGFHQWFANTEMLLDEVRTGVFEASVDVRDALLDTSLSDASYRRRLEETRQRLDFALRRYRSYTHVDAERADLAELDHMVSNLWEATLPMLDLDERGLRVEALESLRLQILPRRQAIERMSERIARLNQSAGEDQRFAVLDAFGTAQRRAWSLGLLTFLLTGVVALVVTRHADRMERAIRREVAKNVEHAAALQRLSDQLVQVAEQERRAIARELHDEVGQALTAVKLDLERVAAVCPAHPPELCSARKTLDGTIGDVRTLSRMLHPMVLEDLGLQAAIDWHLREFSRRTGVASTLTQAGLNTRLPASIEACVYRTIQEATTNVARHAGASRCQVEVERGDGYVTAVVEDDGRGMPAAPAAAGPPRGLGLISIGERVRGFGGTFEVGPGANGGARLLIRLPVGGASPS
jgi:signal transduction histidine kinase